MIDTYKTILADVSIESGYSADEIEGGSQIRDLVRVRWKLWRRLVEKGWSASEIGRRMGFDHSTILHGLKQCGYGPMPKKPVAVPKDIPIPKNSERLVREEHRRAQIIKDYWAKRGHHIDAMPVILGTNKGKTVVGLKSLGIPVREAK